ncbi:hypothetical protein GTQ43_22005 [Nostoc sp. KVJ3]|uniref:hypothetical protein n=1 Tax=Nostoc sp. KVJ3 TaxID=457945 RepID=UPI0022380E24|nr:hypothetical protein [Nostoc sp. KVJ3]MCW5316394.1 hypothetical protein [Nostoc sp. KVJ3]
MLCPHRVLNIKIFVTRVRVAFRKEKSEEFERRVREDKSYYYFAFIMTNRRRSLNVILYSVSSK